MLNLFNESLDQIQHEAISDNIKEDDNGDVYLNGYVNGKVIDTLNVVVDDLMDGVFITKEKDKTIKNCINCGLCAKYCPMKINPKYVLDKQGDVEEDYVKKCLDCGLCNYVCPSNINLRKMIKGDNND